MRPNETYVILNREGFYNGRLRSCGVNLQIGHQFPPTPTRKASVADSGPVGHWPSPSMFPGKFLLFLQMGF